ncbi:MAG: hypothetical protein KDD64_17010, partial [Bdellovibrionales bacterium]|nr:hypothetical protein [Bdellovibrionales bacterium]
QEALLVLVVAVALPSLQFLGDPLQSPYEIATQHILGGENQNPAALSVAGPEVPFDPDLYGGGTSSTMPATPEDGGIAGGFEPIAFSDLNQTLQDDALSEYQGLLKNPGTEVPSSGG